MEIIKNNEKIASNKEKWITLILAAAFGYSMNKLFLHFTSIDSFILTMIIGTGSMCIFECGYYYFRENIHRKLKKVITLRNNE